MILEKIIIISLVGWAVGFAWYLYRQRKKKYHLAYYDEETGISYIEKKPVELREKDFKE